MALTPLAIADGQLPAAKGTLYTCPALTTVIITTFSLSHTGAADRTINLYVNRTGTSRRILGKNRAMVVGDSIEKDKTAIVLEAGDLLEGDASAAAEIDYVFSGYSKT
jgi:hypothetical protein